MNEHLAEVMREEAAGNPKKAAKSVQRFWKLSAAELTDEDLVAALKWAETRPDQDNWAIAQTRAFVRTLARNHPSDYPETVRFCADYQTAKQALASETRAELVVQARAAAANRMLMTTTHVVPGREITNVITVVSGACVMSRNFVSDIGSDLVSTFGGALGGIEKAVETARQTAMGRLEEAAKLYDADAVIAIDTSVQTVSDKAQLVMLTGTAVTLAQRHEDGS